MTIHDFEKWLCKGDVSSSNDPSTPKGSEKESHGLHHEGCICSILCQLEKNKKLFHFKTKNCCDEIIGYIKCFDKCSGCLVIIQPEVLSPKLPAIATIISCTDIESISFEVNN